jgi:NadR type nicotinamide-nucleotide adenylyltransferase
LAIANDLSGTGRFKIHIVGDIETIDNKPESSQVWAEYTYAILGKFPDVVFSSEQYGIRWANCMHAEHRMVDLPRLHHPVSGTVIRDNFYVHSNELPDVTKAQVLPRVVVLGSESTGSTTLANQLGEYYVTPVVPEYGRMLAEVYKIKHGVGPPLDYWDEQVFRLVAHGQNMLEERYAESANGLLICDTDSLATAVWYERYHGKPSAYFNEVGYREAKKHSLYILTDYHGVEWEDDGTRDGENERAWMQESFEFMLNRSGVPWIKVSGPPDERFKTACAEIDRVALDRHAYGVVG